jgi:hypothetical protein
VPIGRAVNQVKKETIMTTLKKIFLLIFSALFLVSFTACERQGPAEKAGEKIDKATEDAREGMEEAGEEMRETVDKAGEKLEETGEKLQN